MVHNRYVGQARRQYRRLTCRECGKGWVVEEKRVVPKAGYLCPRCCKKK